MRIAGVGLMNISKGRVIGVRRGRRRGVSVSMCLCFGVLKDWESGFLGRALCLSILIVRSGEIGFPVIVCGSRDLRRGRCLRNRGTMRMI